MEENKWGRFAWSTFQLESKLACGVFVYSYSHKTYTHSEEGKQKQKMYMEAGWLLGGICLCSFFKFCFILRDLSGYFSLGARLLPFSCTPRFGRKFSQGVMWKLHWPQLAAKVFPSARPQEAVCVVHGHRSCMRTDVYVTWQRKRLWRSSCWAWSPA